MQAEKAERRPGGGGVLNIAFADDDDNPTVRHVPPPRSADAAASLRAWYATVEHLHSRGLPAAVPPFPAAWLRRRGIRPDWETAA